MHRQLLAFEHFRPPHTGAAIADILNRVIARNLLKRNFIALTGDSASNNLTAAKALADKLSEGTDVKWSYSESYFHCSSHVFNLVAEALCKPFIKVVKVNGQNQEVDDDHLESLNEPTADDVPPARGRMLTALAKLSAMARIGNQSTTFAQEWVQLCRIHKVKPLKLITPAPTRWGSRYEQIERAKLLRSVYEEMVESDSRYNKYRLSTADWNLLDWLREILRQLSICSKYVSVTTSPSIAFMIPCFSRLIDTLESKVPPAGIETAQERQAREEAVEAALEKLKKYYRHTVKNPFYTFGLRKLPCHILNLCSHLSVPVLDPRFGWKHIKEDATWDADPDTLSELEGFTIEEALRWQDENKDRHAKYSDSSFISRFGPRITGDQRALWKVKFIDCYNSYKATYFGSLPDDYIPIQTTARSLFISEPKGCGNTLSSVSRNGVDEDGVPRSEIPSEVARFFALSDDHPLDLDVLEWWKSNQKKYPVIARIARDILPMQPSSVETERVHSGARTLLNWNQAQMGVATIEAALKLKCFAKYNGNTKVKAEELPTTFEEEFHSVYNETADVKVNAGN